MLLSAAYDLVVAVLVNPADDEDLALTLNGKKKKISKAGFVAAFNKFKLDETNRKMVEKKAGIPNCLYERD